jgi:transcriptional regulator with XRE-family HTH domain
MATRMTCDKVGSQYRRFNDSIRGELKRQKITQDELAERLGVTHGTLSQRLNGNIEWLFKDVLKTMDYLQIKFEDVL